MSAVAGITGPGGIDQLGCGQWCPMTARDRFPFAFDSRYALPARLLGVRPDTTFVEVTDDVVRARFGPWTVETPRSNVTSAEVSGPYSVPKTIGPAHLSFSDRGLTFATNPSAGVCLTFRDPVRGIDPLGLIRHPGLTVTVEDPEALAHLLDPIGTERRERQSDLAEQEIVDELHTMTASELRSFARENEVDDVEHVGSASKAELVEAIEHDPDTDLEHELRS